MVQNKMHWAAHGHTAAEIVNSRANAELPHMGMQSWIGSRPSKTEARVAKNYLNADELDLSNRLVTTYLDFAELQAMNRKVMHMADWAKKLDDFLRLGDREILTHAGKISRQAAESRADSEFEKYRQLEAMKPSPAEIHFHEALEKTKKLEASKKGKGKEKEGT